MSAPASVVGESLLSFSCSIPCDLHSVREASLQSRAFLTSEGLSEDELSVWELVIVEACNNAVEHTPLEHRGKPISLVISSFSHEVTVQICDHTPGFDWEAAGELPDSDSERGRGVFLIKALTDRALYFRNATGNLMILTKSRFAVRPRTQDLPARLAEQEEMLVGLTQELSSAYEALVAIFRHSRDLGSTPDLLVFARQLLVDLLRITEADAAILRLAEHGSTKLQSEIILPTEMDCALAAIDSASSAPSIELEAVRLRQDVWFESGRTLPEDDPLCAVPRLHSGVVHPFFFQDHVLGTLTINRRLGRPAFGAAELSLLHTFTEFLVIQYGNLRFLQERMQAQVVRRDIEIAADVQRSLQPPIIPALAPFEVVGRAESAREVGGDFFDIIPAGDHGLLLVIADVMGKGLPAALFATVLRSVVRATNSFVGAPGALLTRVNELLYDDLSRVDMFATAQLAFLARHSRTLLVASAGHCPLLYCSEGDSLASAVRHGGLPLGIERNHVYEDYAIHLPPRTRIMLYTDGIVECRPPDGEIFGEERLATWLATAKVPHNRAAPLADDLVQRVSDFARGESTRDDQTYIIVTENSSRS